MRLLQRYSQKWRAASLRARTSASVWRAITPQAQTTSGVWALIGVNGYAGVPPRWRDFVLVVARRCTALCVNFFERRPAPADRILNVGAT